jgi:serine/threonine protein kinase
MVFARKLLHIPSLTPDVVEKEKRAIRKLCGPRIHRHIVDLFRAGNLRYSAHVFIDMELCDQSLADSIRIYKQALHVPRAIYLRYLNRIDSFASPELQIWDIREQIAGGLEYIHGHRQVYRDLKPASSAFTWSFELIALVLFSRKDEVWKIADFGFTSEGTSHDCRVSSDRRGTSGYMAPEFFDETPSFNNKLDIWSMGCILYELVVGQKAFQTDQAVHIFISSKMHRA